MTGAEHPLDSPVWWSLTGPHAFLAAGSGAARRYRADVSPFAATDGGDESWDALLALVEPGERVVHLGQRPLAPEPPTGWDIVIELTGVQMVATDAFEDRTDPELTVLGPADVDNMVELAARTQPGPFTRGTRLLGTYLGFKDDGKLVAMAGERLHPQGWCEISAVCTDPVARGRGLATRLTRAVAHGIRERGETPFLHAATSNENAIRLYHSLGFEHRRDLVFTGMQSCAEQPKA